MASTHRHLKSECCWIRTTARPFGVVGENSAAVAMVSVALAGAYRGMNANCRRSCRTESAEGPVGHRTLGCRVSNLRVIQMLAEGGESFRSSTPVQLAWE